VQREKRKAASALFEVLQAKGRQTAFGTNYPWIKQSSGEFAGWIEDEENQKIFNSFVETQLAGRSELTAEEQGAVKAYRDAQSGKAESQVYSPDKAHRWPVKPYTGFTGAAFKASAPPELKQQAMERINTRYASVLTGKPISEMSDSEMKEDLEAYSVIRDSKDELSSMSHQEKVAWAEEEFREYSDLIGRAMNADADALTRRMEDIHRYRALKEGLKKKTSSVGNVERASVGGQAIVRPGQPAKADVGTQIKAMKLDGATAADQAAFDIMKDQAATAWGRAQKEVDEGRENENTQETLAVLARMAQAYEAGNLDSSTARAIATRLTELEG